MCVKTQACKNLPINQNKRLLPVSMSLPLNHLPKSKCTYFFKDFHVPKCHQNSSLHSQNSIIEEMFQPSRTFFEVDEIKNGNKSHDQIVKNFSKGSSYIFCTSTIICSLEIEKCMKGEIKFFVCFLKFNNKSPTYLGIFLNCLVLRNPWEPLESH